MHLEFVTDCVNAPSGEWVNEQMEKAREVSKRGKWANILLKTADWTEFDIKEDYATRLFVNDEFVIFVHSAIEHFYKKVGK